MVTSDPSMDDHWPAPQPPGAGWRAAQRHSRRVRALRIGLPLVSAVLIAALLVSWRSLPTPVGNLDLGDLGVSGSTLTMENPKLTGFGARGMAYDVTAERALQDLTDPQVVRLETISGRVQQPDGGWATLDARGGVYDSANEFLRLDRDIMIRVDDGKRAFLEAAEVDLKAQTVKSDRPVRLEMPGGRVRADRMDVEAGGKTIVLTGRVVLDLRLDGGTMVGVNDAEE